MNQRMNQRMNEHYCEYYENRASVWIISVAIAIACLFGAVISWHRLETAHENELREAHAEMEKRAQTMNIAVEQYVEMTLISIDNTLRQLRLAYLANPKEFDQTAQESIKNLPSGLVRFVTVFDASGDLIYSSNGAVKRFNAKDYEHFNVHTQTQEDKLFISQPLDGRITGARIIQLTRPIWTKDGRFLGVIGLPLRPSFVAERLNDLHIEASDVISIVRMDGSFVSRSRNLEEALKTKVSSQRPYLSAKPGEAGLFRDASTIDKMQLTFSWRRMSRWPLAVIVGVDERPQLSNLAEKWHGERLRMGMVIAAIVVLSTGIVVLLQRVVQHNRNLHASQSRFRQLFEKNQTILRNASDGMCIVNAEGCVTEASDSFCTMLGYTHDSIIGLHVTQWDIQYSATKIQKAIRRTLQGDTWMGKRIELNSFYRSCEGRVMPVEVSVVPFNAQQEKLLFCTIRDVTSRKRAQFALETLNHTLQIRSAEAEAANRAKSTFLATMSHEIRTPLNAIIGMGYLLQQSELGGQQREQVRAIQVSGNNLLALVNDVLDVSKIEAGAIVLESIPLSLHALCDEMSLMFSSTAQNKGLTLCILPLPATLPDVVNGDPLRIKQILMNLLGNAIKFTEQGTVQLEIQSIQSLDHEEKLRFAVRDTGIGITLEQQDKLFKPFSQADASTTRKYGGTGLGLSIVRQLAELMGGQAGVDNPHGHGSTFWFEIPLKVSTIPAPIHAVDKVDGGDGVKPSTSKIALPSAELERVQPLIAELECMLNENRMDALLLSHTIEKALKGTLAEALYQGVSQRVGRLQYAEARTELATLKEQLCMG